MIKVMDISDALASLLPDGYWSLIGSNAIFNDGVAYEPTTAEIATEVTRLQEAYDSQAYSRQRQAAYAALNQDEMRFDDTVNGTTTWVDAINAIKEEFPK